MIKSIIHFILIGLNIVALVFLIIAIAEPWYEYKSGNNTKTITFQWNAAQEQVEGGKAFTTQYQVLQKTMQPTLVFVILSILACGVATITLGIDKFRRMNHGSHTFVILAYAFHIMNACFTTVAFFIFYGTFEKNIQKEPIFCPTATGSGSSSETINIGPKYCEEFIFKRKDDSDEFGNPKGLWFMIVPLIINWITLALVIVFVKKGSKETSGATTPKGKQMDTIRQP